MAKSYQINDVYNEVDRRKRQQAERDADPRVFFYNLGNPFLGFMHFLRRVPVKKEPIDEKVLISNYSSIASDKIKEEILFLVIVVIACVFVFLYKSNVISSNVMTIFGLLFFATLLGIAYYFKRKNKTSGRRYTLYDYKNYVIESAISSEVEELVYEPHFGLPNNVYKDLKVIMSGNRYHTEDLITGKYHNVYFAQSDLVVEYKGDKSSITYFKGRWVGFRYPKSFQGEVIIKDKSFIYGRKRKELSDIELENPAFNQMFIVKSSDMHLAYYLLTPQLMERFIYLKQNTKGKIIICFKDGILHIFINNGHNSFEPNMRHINLVADVQKFKYDFSLISGLVSILNVDNNVYVQGDIQDNANSMYQQA